MVGSPELFVKTYRDALDYAREHKLGIFGAKNSENFIRLVNAEYEKVFSQEPKKSDAPP